MIYLGLYAIGAIAMMFALIGISDILTLTKLIAAIILAAVWPATLLSKLFVIIMSK